MIVIGFIKASVVKPNSNELMISLFVAAKAVGIYSSYIANI